MSWFDRLVRKGEDKPFTVSLNEIDDLLNKELEKQLKPFKANVKKEYSSIQTVVNELKNCLNALEKAELSSYFIISS